MPDSTSTKQNEKNDSNSSSSEHTFDAIIVGAGSAGLAALREVRKRTNNYLIVNAGLYGTTCARVGCMPSKLLIEAANAYHRRHTFEAFGITGSDALQADLTAEVPLTELQAHCATLMAQLERHNAKEEPIVYSQADSGLDEEARAQLHDFIGRQSLPDGWVCQMA